MIGDERDREAEHASRTGSDASGLDMDGEDYHIMKNTVTPLPEGLVRKLLQHALYKRSLQEEKEARKAEAVERNYADYLRQKGHEVHLKERKSKESDPKNPRVMGFWIENYDGESVWIELPAIPLSFKPPPEVVERIERKKRELGKEPSPTNTQARRGGQDFRRGRKDVSEARTSRGRPTNSRNDAGDNAWDDAGDDAEDDAGDDAGHGNMDDAWADAGAEAASQRSSSTRPKDFKSPSVWAGKLPGSQTSSSRFRQERRRIESWVSDTHSSTQHSTKSNDSKAQKSKRDSQSTPHGHHNETSYRNLASTKTSRGEHRAKDPEWGFSPDPYPNWQAGPLSSPVRHQDGRSHRSRDGPAYAYDPHQRYSSANPSSSHSGKAPTRRPQTPTFNPTTVFAGKGWVSPHPLSRSPTDIASSPQSRIALPSLEMQPAATITYDQWKQMQERGMRFNRQYLTTESETDRTFWPGKDRRRADESRAQQPASATHGLQPAMWNPRTNGEFPGDSKASNYRRPAVQSERSSAQWSSGRTERPRHPHGWGSSGSEPSSSDQTVTEASYRGRQSHRRSQRSSQQTKPEPLSAWSHEHSGSKEAHASSGLDASYSWDEHRKTRSPWMGGEDRSFPNSPQQQQHYGRSRDPAMPHAQEPGTIRRRRGWRTPKMAW